MFWPSTNWRPSSWIARTVAATTVLAPRRCSRPARWPVASSPGSIFFDSSMACAARWLISAWSWPSWVCAAKSARPSWSAVSASAVSVSGTRSSASARRISARPSALEIGYSRSSDSIAQNGAGCLRTVSTHGVPSAMTAAQSSRPCSSASSRATCCDSSRTGAGRRSEKVAASAAGAGRSVRAFMAAVSAALERSPAYSPRCRITRQNRGRRPDNVRHGH